MAIVFTVAEIFSIMFLIPGIILLILGVVFLFRKERRPAFILLIIACFFLVVGLALLGWSLYEINLFCPANPAECG